MKDIDKNFDFDAIRNLSDGDLIALLNNVYGAGYSEGHRLTAESCYDDVLPQERAETFFDPVSDFVINYMPHQS